MNTLLLVSILSVLLSYGGAVVSANGSDQSAGRPRAQASTRSAADVITIVGCVQRETEYRARISDGKGGVAGTGVGANNEFVLHSIRTVSNETLKPTATPGIRAEEVYSVTGKLERELTRAVGRQIAMSGYVEIAPSDGTGQVKDLPRFNASGWHIVSEACGPAAPRR